MKKQWCGVGDCSAISKSHPENMVVTNIFATFFARSHCAQAICHIKAGTPAFQQSQTNLSLKNWTILLVYSTQAKTTQISQKMYELSHLS